MLMDAEVCVHVCVCVCVCVVGESKNGRIRIRVINLMGDKEGACSPADWAFALLWMLRHVCVSKHTNEHTSVVLM